MSNEKFKHGKNKILSNYGGIGSLVETTNCSVIIETFDNWGYLFHDIAKYIIIDDRLLSRLRFVFKNLQYLVNVPNEYDKNVYPRANYFPKWFFCPKCRSFKRFKEWHDDWNKLGKNGNSFYPPKCSNKDCNGAILEQIRFIMTCPNGHIQDIPWDYWNNRTSLIQPEQLFTECEESEENKGSIKLNFESKCCNNQQLTYMVSSENPDLSGIHITCKNCGKSEDLGGLFGFRLRCSGKSPWLGNNQYEKCDGKLKVVIKTSNSNYYANLISSIYIPIQQINLSNENRALIAKWIERGKSTEDIIKDMLLDYNIPEYKTKKYLSNDDKYITEEEFRLEEYEYFLSNESESQDPIKFSKINVIDKIKEFETIIRIDKLKQISVQTSFTRQMPVDSDSILLNESDFSSIKYEVKRQSTSSKNINTKLLPGIESFGEAILFIIQKNRLDEWSNNPVILNRANKLKENATNSQRKYISINSDKITPQFLLIHTLSHLIIKELEYVIGYTASSLKERLYISDKMAGFMIIAIEGSEGSLGGLVSQCDDITNLNRIVCNAIDRSKNCSSDPICERSDEQGVENLNLAACYSCTLLPDITCEMFNSFLDRRLLIDNDYGFFKIN